MAKIVTGDIVRFFVPQNSPAMWISVAPGVDSVILDTDVLTGSAWAAMAVGSGKFAFKNANGTTASFLDVTSTGTVFLNDDAVDSSTHWRLESSKTTGLFVIKSHFDTFLIAGQGGDKYKVFGDTHPDEPRAHWLIQVDASP